MRRPTLLRKVVFSLVPIITLLVLVEGGQRIRYYYRFGHST